MISAILFGGVPRELIEVGLRGDLELVTSPPLLAELQEVLTREFDFPATMAASVRAELEALAALVDPVDITPVLEDASDDVVLATAAAAQPDVIVTGDKKLLELGSYGTIPIIGPRALLNRLQASTQGNEP